MGRDIQDVQNVDAPTADYPNGRMRDKAGATSGTILGEPLHGDVVQFFSKLMRDANPVVTPNGLPDNETNGYQLFTAFINYIRNVLVATETAKGTVEKATTAEAQAGTADKYLDAALFQLISSTTTRNGVVEKATNYESQIGEADKNITADLFQNESALRATNTDADNGILSSKWVSCSVLKHITGGIKRKVVSIGDWNMDALSQVSIPHGEAIADIIGMSCIIRNDTDTGRISFIGDSVGIAALSYGSSMNVTSTNIVLNRTTGGLFDNTSYNSTSYNRGWVILDLLA